MNSVSEPGDIGEKDNVKGYDGKIVHMMRRNDLDELRIKGEAGDERIRIRDQIDGVMMVGIVALATRGMWHMEIMISYFAWITNYTKP